MVISRPPARMMVMQSVSLPRVPLGNVDGAENNVTALRDHSDVTQYYCFDEHTRIPDIIVISSNIWNKMSDNQKQIMQDTAAKMTEDYKTAWADFENEVLEAATSGSNPVELIRDGDTAAFQEACQPNRCSSR